jgi:small conductance mechanosensitive channel
MAVGMALDPQQIAACGPSDTQGWLCRTVFRVSGNQDAAEVADALARPLRILFILLLAWIAVKLARRFVARVARHMRDGPAITPFRDAGGMPLPSDVEKRRREQRVDTLASVLRNVVTVGIWTIAGLIVLGEVGIDLAPLLAGAGVAGIVIGFGAQQVVRDFLAGLFMLLEDQYGVGDVIDMGEASGTVEWVSLRVTRLRDVEGVVWWVPNGQVTRVGNKSQQWSRALLDIAIAPDTDIPTATEVIQETADEMWRDPKWRDRMLDQPDVWGVEDIGVGGILLRLVVKTVPLEQWNVARELRARIKAAFDAAGVSLPVQQQRITYEVGGSLPPPFPDPDRPADPDADDGDPEDGDPEDGR